MAKSAKNRRASKKRSAELKPTLGKATAARRSMRSAVRRNKSTSTQQAEPPEPNHGSKQANVIAMLRLSAGTSISAMMNATGWQPHSVRGFLAGVVRKKLRLNLTSEKLDDGQRIYRIIESGGSRSTSRRRGRQSA